ncbi:MAG TPA: hypothetical protein VEP30_03115 [Chthoniobacterales bacterium]|nr:hypothetical protein [Chthoniobacterales bacterium]
MFDWLIALKLAATVLTGICGLLSFATKTKVIVDGQERLTAWGKILFVLLIIGAPVAIVTQYMDLAQQAKIEQRAIISLTDFKIRIFLRIPLDQPAARSFAGRVRQRFEELNQRFGENTTFGQPRGLPLQPGPEPRIFPSPEGDEQALNRFFLSDVRGFLRLASKEAARVKAPLRTRRILKWNF